MGEVSLSGAGERLTIVMQGKIDQRLGSELRRSFDTWLEQHGPPQEVLLDLRGVDDYDILGRAELVTLHGKLAKRGRRCVYVVERARIRGMALLTIGEIGDQGSRTVATVEQADAWLRGRDLAAEAGIEQGVAPRRRS